MNADPTNENSAHPIAIYVHAPFCRGRCPYCSTYSVSGEEERCVPFIRALETEWRQLLEDNERLRDPQARLVSVYVGGGTPNVLGPDLLTETLRILRNGIEWSEQPEITIELNPEDTDHLFAERMLAAGYNRASLGVQSFDDRDLRALGRRHDAEATRRAIAALREAGFANLNFEILFGLPDQQPDAWEATLRETVRIGPEHVGCHPLSRAEETQLDRLLRAGYGPAPLDEQLLNQYTLAQEILRIAGYEFYEVTNAARPGYRCRHNLHVWNRDPAFGLGPGAHSFDGEMRWRNAADLHGYVQSLNTEHHNPPRQGYRLGPEDAARETLFLGLRRAEGLTWERLSRWVTPAELSYIMRQARFLAAQGFLKISAEGMRLQPQAYYVADSVTLELIRAVGGSES